MHFRHLKHQDIKVHLPMVDFHFNKFKQLTCSVNHFFYTLTVRETILNCVVSNLFTVHTLPNGIQMARNQVSNLSVSLMSRYTDKGNIKEKQKEKERTAKINQSE